MKNVNYLEDLIPFQIFKIIFSILLKNTKQLNWFEINNDAIGANSTNSQFKFEATMLKSS